MSEGTLRSHPLGPGLLDLDDNVLARIAMLVAHDGRFWVIQEGYQDPLQSLASVCKRLRHLVLAYVCTGLRIRRPASQGVPPLSALRELDIGGRNKPALFLWIRSREAQRTVMGTPSSDRVNLRHLCTNLSGLHSLDMVGCDAPDLDAIASLQELRQLAISWRSPSHAHQQAFSKLSALTALVLLGVPRAFASTQMTGVRVS
jgi:hypothetical protein